jgi:hypothetical protein
MERLCRCIVRVEPSVGICRSFAYNIADGNETTLECPVLTNLAAFATQPRNRARCYGPRIPVHGA